jgi:perosamine synthetase
MPTLEPADSEALQSALAELQVGRGVRAEAFEAQIAEKLGSPLPLTFSSGREAMRMALEALGVEHEREVILPTYTCPTLLGAIQSLGAHPVLADVSERRTLCPESAARLRSSKTAAIIVPHILGHFAETREFLSLGIPVIEDFSQALTTGRAFLAAASVFSFGATKCLTTGEGGAVAFQSEKLRQKLKESLEAHSSPSSLLSDLAGSLGSSQLQRFESFLERREKIAAQYDQRIPSALRWGNAPTMHFRYLLKVPRGEVKTTIGHFSKFKIHTRHGVDTLLHRKLGLSDAAFGNAVAFFESTVSLPIYPLLDQEQIDRIVEATLQLPWVGP